VGGHIVCMNVGLRLLLAQHGGLVLRSQLLDIGLSPSRITQLCRAGALIVVRRGVYADAELWESLDEYRGRPRLRARAAVMKLQRGWVMSHDSAALELGMPLLWPKASLTHVTRPGFSAAWTRYGVKHHYARYRPSQLLDIDGRRVLDAARTAVDLAREHGEQEGVVACDWALRNGTTRAALLEALVPMASWPYVVRARSAVEHADPRAENANETLGRLLVQELGIGPVDLQFPVAITGGVAWCDLRVGNHIFEIDGRIKYQSTDRGGVSDRDVSQVVWDERKRQRLVCAEGLGMSRIIWEDYWGVARKEAMARLRAEYAITLARFGPELSPRLAASAERLRAIHGLRDRAHGA
jgi:hypothetical protein